MRTIGARTQWGLDNYSRELPDGRQVWARVNGGIVDDAGVNAAERPWDDSTGFKRRSKKGQGRAGQGRA
jgi:hypothetical protein